METPKDRVPVHEVVLRVELLVPGQVGRSNLVELAGDHFATVPYIWAHLHGLQNPFTFVLYCFPK